MIIDKSPLPDDPTPAEAPPSYDTVSVDNRVGRVYNRNEKSLEPIHIASTPASPSSSSLSSPPTSKPPSSSTHLKDKGKANSTWFNFTASRTAREVRATVLLLVRDLVREQHVSGGASLSILESCADACAGNSLSFSTLLQEKSIENHTPLYWAIVKRLPDGDSALPDLLTSLISFASPLTPETISDVRHACLLNSDQLLFQRLRMSPEFAPLSGTDEMLLGGSIPPDSITVKDVSGDEGSFAADFEIVHFQKRMLVSKHIELEFIARARMWQLAFRIAEDNCRDRDGPRPGSWYISLSLLENSPPTWVDSRLIIAEPMSTPSPVPSPPPTSPLERTKTRGRPKPNITIRLKPSGQLAVPPLRRHNRHNPQQTDSVVVSLEDSVMGSSLQYAGTSYIAPDETLRARLEARLGKASASDTDCVIC